MKRAILSERALVLAPHGRDAKIATGMLGEAGIAAATCASLPELIQQLDVGAGVVVLTEEALATSDLAPLAGWIAAQPEWSDMPFVLLTSHGGGLERNPSAQRYLVVLGNAAFIERPFHPTTLVSLARSALRGRRRQYEARSRLEALRESEARFEAIANSIDQMIWSTRPDGYHDYYNARWYAYTGVAEGSTDGTKWNGMFHPDDRPRARQLWQHSLATGEPYQIEYRLRHRSGRYRWVLGRAQPYRDSTGKIVRWFGTCTDIQEIVEAREVLTRSREELETLVRERTAALERAQETLRQSQKMEAVGQLTGGIAHDFNNMLTGIIGAMDVMRRRIASGRTGDLERFMDAASASAQRAAALTARLLAFSRRQSLNPKPTDVNALTVSLDELLRRSISENIALRIVADIGAPKATADANQLENAILNLVINARDAMPKGGQLTVRTSAAEVDNAQAAAADIKPGRYVVIAVSDTGVGIAPEILDKVFDPFFSTKPTGQGTGLGLSMVYGFARQSGGQVLLESKVGQGTTVKIYLPAAAAGSEADSAAPDSTAVEGEGQTVLLVEDDASVRLLVRDVLEELHYRTIEAGDADAAIPILASARAIDLMISDVGLPGMNGRQLAEIAREHRPGLPILFITGYAENAAIRAEFLGTNMGMIAKPFAIEGLSAKIAEMMPRG